MIKEIEELMVHWGEQSRLHGLGGGLGSQLGAIIEWGGAPPRGTPGARVLVSSGGVDYIASEIEAAVAALERSPGNGPRLAKLAQYRYCGLATVREQMRVIDIPEGADRTYRNWINRLHLSVMETLTARSTAARGYRLRKQGGQLRVANGGNKQVS